LKNQGAEILQRASLFNGKSIEVRGANNKTMLNVVEKMLGAIITLKNRLTEVQESDVSRPISRPEGALATAGDEKPEEPEVKYMANVMCRAKDKKGNIIIRQRPKAPSAPGIVKNFGMNKYDCYPGIQSTEAC
jgi:hypothetical protein